MFYIFEMANNHQGSVEHAKLIVDTFAFLANKQKINAAIKLQFRQLDTFIHKDYKESDLKFVKRFNSTRLLKEQFKEIVDYIHEKNMVSVATPFDNESLPWLADLNISVVKVASCSIDDWPLLEDIAKINKKIIISTGGASIDHLKRVYDLFKHHKRDFAFMHCVGEYPTLAEHANLARITRMRDEFPDIEIGFSTHESPEKETLAPVACALGCTILEKHVGVPTDIISLNGYSCTAAQMRKVVQKVKVVEKALNGKPREEKETLLKLKRGVYLKRSLKKGEKLGPDDFYYAMPVQESQFNASSYHDLVNRTVLHDMSADSALMIKNVNSKVDSTAVAKFSKQAKELLDAAGVSLYGNEKIELSAHYGLENFASHGALIIDKINREYCKKIIVSLPGQQHPTHHHIKKEEAFELLHGDCKLVLNNKEVNLKLGKPVLISRGVKHSFSSVGGCVVEEISTTHIPGDSIYEDPNINKLKLEDRKISLEKL